MKRYKNIKIARNINENVGTLGSRYYITNTYPEIPLNKDDIYVETEFGDRLDLLANQFYGDVTMYWIISAANPNKVDFGSLFVKEGTQLRIPTKINNIIDEYSNINDL
jgi:phage tail protein X